MSRSMNKKIAASVLLTLFVLAGLSSPAVAQASTDAVLVMHFDEGSGTIAKDESGHGNDGTIHGATWTTGISGKALSFDGRDDYVSVTSSPSLDITGKITIEAWVKPNDVVSGQGLVCKRNLNTYTPYVLILHYSYLSYQYHDGASWRGYDSADVTADEWQHIVVAFSPSDNHIYFYKNGVSFGDSVTTGTPRGNSLPLWIGRDPAYTYFNGIIDEVAIYNRALSPEEIKAHYLAKRAGGSTEESTLDLIKSVLTRIDALKRDNIDTSLIEQSLTNAQDAYDSGNHDESYELAQNAQKMADDAYEAQQHIESAESEIDGAKSIGADVKDAESKLKEAKEALDKGNYEYSRNWAADASELAKRASIGSVQIKDLKALATRYDQRTVAISGTIRDIETVYGEGYTFALDDGSGMISVVYHGSLGDIKDGDRVAASGVFEASSRALVADTVQKSGGSGSAPGFEAIFIIVGLLAAVYLSTKNNRS